MPTRTSRTAWNGTLETGSGQVELSSSKVGTYDVSFPKRAADDAGGTTSPEELIAAAHSACFAMQLSANIAEAGGTPQSLEVTADVSLGPDEEQRRLQAHRHRAQGRRRGRGPGRGRLPEGRRRRQGRLPGQQGPRGRRHHARRLAGLAPHLRLQRGRSAERAEPGPDCASLGVARSVPGTAWPGPTRLDESRTAPPLGVLL